MEIDRSPPQRPWFTAKEAADYIGVTTITLYSYCKCVEDARRSSDWQESRKASSDSPAKNSSSGPMALRNKGRKMYSLTIHFGPSAMVWSFLFKEKEAANVALQEADVAICEGNFFRIEDDYGQIGVFGMGKACGCLLEDMDLVEEARIYRSLANARGEVKARQRAATDPVIRQAQNAGPSVLQPRFNG